MKPDLHMDIFQNEGMVVIKFDRKVDEVSITHEVARQIAEEIARKANNAQINLAPDASILAEKIKGKMITRLTHVIRSSIEKGRLPGYIAESCVDVVFSEVF